MMTEKTFTTSQDEAVSLVNRFLQKMEERDLATAEPMMAPNATITFPGSRSYATQAEMVAASKGRYLWVKKSIELVDCLSEDKGHTVYIMGTLYGVNRHGLPFQDIRFIDRFEIMDGAIYRQDVWNDLAESGVLDKKAH
jgi:hypothetical protein